MLAHTVAASASANDRWATVTHLDRSMAGSLEALSLASKPLTERDIQVENEILCLALNIYFEARSEPEQGQLAVGHVVMNRVSDRHYPNTVCSVVQQGGEEQRYRCQFSWWCDGQSDKPLDERAWLKSLELAIKVFFGDSVDPTNGALWYHADYVNPYWRDALILGSKIGQHIFYLKKKQPKYASN